MKSSTMKWRLMGALLFLVISGGNVLSQVQTAKYITINSHVHAFYEYLPQGYSSGTTYPLIVFLHGLGELGAGNSSTLPSVLRNGLPKLIQEGKFPTSFTVNGASHRFIVISPQFTAWPTPADINAVIDYAVRTYRVNTRRIYVTGLSMGGGGTWSFAADAAYNQRLAAIVPVCGAVYPANFRAYAVADGNTPVWATHNSGDPQVPVSYTNDFITLIKQRKPNAIAKKTIFNVSGHDAWTKTYDPNFRENGMNIYEWMLQYTTGTAPAPPPNQAPTAEAGSDKYLTLPTNSVQLSGKGADADGRIASYAWTKVSGPSGGSISSASSASTSVTTLIAGTYVFQLKVTDDKGASATDQVRVVVNAAPSGDIGSPGTPTLKYVNVNVYGGSNPYNNVQWNNWNVVTAPGNNASIKVASGYFRYSDGSNSAIRAVLSHSQQVRDNGVPYVSGPIAPTEVLRTMSYSSVNRTLKITGLSASKKYTIHLYASRNSPGVFTTFKINGVSREVNTYNNATYKASFTDITPAANGEIVVGIYKNNIWNYLNGFTIIETGASTASARVAASFTAEQPGSGDGAAGAGKLEFETYPNPVKDQLQVRLNNGHKGQMTVKVFDRSGALRQEIKTTKNSDLIQVLVPFEKLGTGTYFIRCAIGDWTETKQVVKIK
jgi:Predicted peptidase